MLAPASASELNIIFELSSNEDGRRCKNWMLQNLSYCKRELETHVAI
jgi:hypothetical protein